MYIALGLLAAGMLALLVTPAIWRRATRLTRQRIENSVPVTLAEIQADKDQLRAEFAMRSRRLEMTIDHVREKTTEQIFEINQKRAEIVRLANERNVKIETIKGLEEHGAQLVAELKSTNERLSEAEEKIRQGEATLAERESEFALLGTRLGAEHRLTAGQKLEIAERGTEIGNINERLAETMVTKATITAERDQLAASLTAEQAALVTERRRAVNFEASLARIEIERTERLAELERRAGEARELVGELASARSRADDLAGRVAGLEAERIELRSQLDQRNAETIRADGDNIAKAIAATEAENVALIIRLTELEADHAGLRAQNEDLRGKVSSEQEIEAENALLRDRLTGVAAEILRLPQAHTNDEPIASDDDKNGKSSNDNAEAQIDAAPAPLRRRTSVPVIKPQLAEANQPDGGEQLRAAPPTATRH